MFGTFTDERDGQVYKTVKIGNLIWFAENLRFNCASSFVYDNNPGYEKVLGRLYTWGMLNDLAPAGWRVPTKDDWLALESFMEERGLGNYMQKCAALRVPEVWNLGGMDKDGTNDFGFSALPAGFGQDGQFWSLGEKTGFWSSTEDDYSKGSAYQFQMNSMFARTLTENKYSAFSVRLIKE